MTSKFLRSSISLKDAILEEGNEVRIELDKRVSDE